MFGIQAAGRDVAKGCQDAKVGTREGTKASESVPSLASTSEVIMLDVSSDED